MVEEVPVLGRQHGLHQHRGKLVVGDEHPLLGGSQGSQRRLEAAVARSHVDVAHERRLDRLGLLGQLDRVEHQPGSPDGDDAQHGERVEDPAHSPEDPALGPRGGFVAGAHGGSARSGGHGTQVCFAEQLRGSHDRVGSQQPGGSAQPLTVPGSTASSPALPHRRERASLSGTTSMRWFQRHRRQTSTV